MARLSGTKLAELLDYDSGLTLPRYDHNTMMDRI